MASSTNSGKLILVTGATGKQGGAALRHLHSNGFAVRALTRDPNKPAALALAGMGAGVAEGSLDNEDSIRRALDGAYGVFSVQTPFEEGIDAEIRQGKRLADLARQAGVSHFVYSSVGAADQGTGIPHFDSKSHIEDHIRSLGMPHTIFRPVYFMENWFWMLDSIRQGALVQPLSPATRLAMVAVDDIGAFVALAFEFPDRWRNRAFELAGDELTMTEIAARFGAKLGRDVQYVQAPWNQFESRAGHEMTVMYRWFEDHGYNVDVSKVRAEYPGLHNFDAWLTEQSF
jgi:uncharacterized protein YbjT (DUF2867 family)